MKQSVLAVLFWLLAAVGAIALPVTLEVGRNADQPTWMSAALSGSLNDPGNVWNQVDDGTTGDGGTWTLFQMSLPKVGNNWNAWGFVYKQSYYDAAHTYVLSSISLHLFGQHMVAPCDAETAPNRVEMSCLFGDLYGSPVGRLFHSVPHMASGHLDTMRLTVADLNGDSVGRIGADGALAASVRLNHIPDLASTLALLLSSFVGLGLARCRLAW
jgi:hypothetical protein